MDQADNCWKRWIILTSQRNKQPFWHPGISIQHSPEPFLPKYENEYDQISRPIYHFTENSVNGKTH